MNDIVKGKKKKKKEPIEIYNKYGNRRYRWGDRGNPHLILLNFNGTHYMDDELESFVRDGYFPTKSEAMRHFIMNGMIDFRKELRNRERELLERKIIKKE